MALLGLGPAHGILVRRKMFEPSGEPCTPVTGTQKAGGRVEDWIALGSMVLIRL